mgnify:FL=1
MKPVVGILCCGFDGKNQFVTDTYVRAIRISGGIPLLIPILPQDFPINSYLDICDGFLLPGGGDFTPFLFNEDPLPGVGQTNLSVDLFQIHFAEEILKRHLPVIGICRGMQVLNAACGEVSTRIFPVSPEILFCICRPHRTAAICGTRFSSPKTAIFMN